MTRPTVIKHIYIQLSLMVNEIHLNQPFCKRLLCSIGVFVRLVFHVWPFITPGAFWGGRLLLGGAVCATVVVDSSIPTHPPSLPPVSSFIRGHSLPWGRFWLTLSSARFLIRRYLNTRTKDHSLCPRASQIRLGYVE